MKLAEITASSLSTVTNRELLNLHFRIHQLYRLWKLKRSNIDAEMLKEKHCLVAAEMKKRGIRHTTNLEQAIEAIFS
jgi:hypothetical protein